MRIKNSYTVTPTKAHRMFTYRRTTTIRYLIGTGLLFNYTNSITQSLTFAEVAIEQRVSSYTFDVNAYYSNHIGLQYITQCTHDRFFRLKKSDGLFSVEKNNCAWAPSDFFPSDEKKKL